MKRDLNARSAKILLAIGIAIGAALLLLNASNIPQLKHDEVISYIAATGHERQYQTTKPSGQWVPVAEWKAFWKLDNVGTFGKIVKDLNSTDIHPPLYFWILNLWSGVYGIHTSTGALLNIPFHVLITLLIFYICRLQKFPPLISASAAVLWMVSNSILEAGSITRQYSLLGLIVILFILAAIKFIDKPTWLNTAWLSLCSLLGLLTHYQFVIPMGITFVWMVIYFVFQKNRLPIIKLVNASVGAALTFLAANPGFLQSVLNQTQNQTIKLFHSQIPYRFNRSLLSFAQLFLPEAVTLSKSSKFYMVPFAIFLVLTILYFIKKRTSKPMINLFFNNEHFILITSLLTLAAVFLLYLVNAFPKHAMSVKYLMLVSPLIIIVFAQLLAQFEKEHRSLIHIFLLALLSSHIIFGFKNTINGINKVSKQSPPAMFQTSIPIILDQTARGILPRNLWYADPASPVYAATQDGLISNFPNLRDYPVLFLISSENDYGNSPEKQETVLALFADHGYFVYEFSGNLFIEGNVFELRKNNR